MSRSIKFRVWFHEPTEPDTGEMVSGVEAMRNDFIEITEHGLIPTDECSILMQFTERWDKDGKEIYEGDIINGVGEDYRFKAKPVVFYNGAFVVMGYGLVGIFSEVIGNIHENPELLES